jgi:hypothetical protein
MGRAAVLLLALAAAAEDLRSPGEQVDAELAEALAAGDVARAVPLLAEAADLYRHPLTPAEAEALLARIGGATRSGDPAIVAAALRALGRTGAPAAALWVEPCLRAKTTVAAVEAAGRLGVGALIPNLLDLARDGADLVVAEQAFLALGGFARGDRDLRERAFRETLQVAQLVAKRAPRWRRLEWSALRALQRLAGRRLNTLEQFADWWRHAKGRKDPFD